MTLSFRKVRPSRPRSPADPVPAQTLLLAAALLALGAGAVLLGCRGSRPCLRRALGAVVLATFATALLAACCVVAAWVCARPDPDPDPDPADPEDQAAPEDEADLRLARLARGLARRAWQYSAPLS